ncbi:hypothetical protein ACFQVD_09100 [Streptosporangium amethystogenes subsp. fukuiense]|uniref:Transcriptional regulator SbtR-like C-terminal domain-containing protein n=1 Tax=Streptosporangium amethystogenes subsp. fukuiense TaxID=698418 RepID=A0ABW2SVF8_9ACTN
MLEAVFRDRVEALRTTAADLATDPDPGHALTAWLRAVTRHAVSNRGLAASLMHGPQDSASTPGVSCHTMITNAGADLLARARHANAVRSDVSITDLLQLVNAISLVAEQEPDGTAQADRLLSLALTGINPAQEAAKDTHHS